MRKIGCITGYNQKKKEMKINEKEEIIKKKEKIKIKKADANKESHKQFK